MNLRRKRDPQQSIKENGTVVVVNGFLCMFFLMASFLFVLSLFVTADAVEEADCAVTSALLGSAVIDKRLFWKNGEVVVSSPDAAYGTFLNCLAGQGYTSESEGMIISESINTERFIVYNCRKGKVEVTEFLGDGRKNSYVVNSRTVTSPNGILVENSSVYAECSVNVHPGFAVTEKVNIKRLADITGGR